MHTCAQQAADKSNYVLDTTLGVFSATKTACQRQPS